MSTNNVHEVVRNIQHFDNLPAPQVNEQNFTARIPIQQQPLQPQQQPLQPPQQPLQQPMQVNQNMQSSFIPQQAQHQYSRMVHQNNNKSSSFNFKTITNYLKNNMYLIGGVILLTLLGYYFYQKKINAKKKRPVLVNQIPQQIYNQPIPINSMNPPVNFNTEQGNIMIDDQELEQNLTNEEMEEIQRQLQQNRNENVMINNQ